MSEALFANVGTPLRTELLSRYMDPLLRGERKTCRDLVQTAIERGVQPRQLYQDLIWPAMEQVDRLYREDQINAVAEHMATRINRTVADHLQSRMERQHALGQRIVITCANGEAEEFSAQMCADLFEADGWDVYLVGGGVPDDEVVSLVGGLQPHTLLIVGSRPTDAPTVRHLIDYIREINACPCMNIMVSGGVFNRASGLWREVKADLFAETATEALELARSATPRQAETRVPGAPKKRRRRRRPPLLAQMDASLDN
jgi:MerR family transcriptional regulator, light-induced transcriptional regulator